MFPRQGHTAGLLSDGFVRISGGLDRLDRSALISEIYDPEIRRLRFPTTSTKETAKDDAARPRIAASIPDNGTVSVHRDALILLYGDNR